MTTYYVEIMPQQKPVRIGRDKNDRRMFSFNVLATSRATTQGEEEIAKILVDEGVGTWGTNIFGPDRTLPAGNGPFLTIEPTPGTPESATHNSPTTPAYENSGYQIVVRGATYAAARTMAFNAYLALRAVRRQEVAAVA